MQRHRQVAPGAGCVGDDLHSARDRTNWVLAEGRIGNEERSGVPRRSAPLHLRNVQEGK